MLKRLKFSLAGALAVVVQLFAAGPASAHSLSINATAVCTPNGPVINYTASAWSSTDPEAAHPQVQILLNGVVVATGAFQASNGNAFSGTVAAPAGQQASVGAFANGPWSNGVLGGQSGSAAVTVPADCVTGIGRFTGGGKQIRVGDLAVTRGLTIHCDLRLSNNLEVNWGGNHFHMTTHLSTTSCTDDPMIVQAPPGAPLDTLVGLGTGRYNGADGYTIRFTLIDAGEPGALDMMSIRIHETANPANVVLNVPLAYLTGGNLQAHYDQPHKRR